VLKPNDTKDTFWYTTNDEKIQKEIDFSAFEEAFKLNPAPIKKAGGRDEPDPGKAHHQDPAAEESDGAHKAKECGDLQTTSTIHAFGRHYDSCECPGQQHDLLGRH
jgi:hypothetical protein